MRSVVHFITAFGAVLSATFIFIVLLFLILNNTYNATQNDEIQSLIDQLTIQNEYLIVLTDRANFLQINITNDFNRTFELNNTINEYYAYFANYSCQQIERINNITPGCGGEILLTGDMPIEPLTHGLIINGSQYESQLIEDQQLIDIIINRLAIINASLANLNMISIKRINNITVDPNGNIDLIGECGVDINVTSSGIVIDTCLLQNNATVLVIQLNNTYYTILNQTESVNATMISLVQILNTLDIQVDGLADQIVKNINGVTPNPTTKNIDLTSNRDHYVRFTNNTSGDITITNLGIVSINNMTSPTTRNIDIDAGIGATVTNILPNTIKLTNILANIFEIPCIVRAGTVVVGSFPTPNIVAPVSSWPAFSANVKTSSSCPTIFAANTFIQPEGLWTLTLLFEGLQSFVSTNCPAPNGCGMSLAYGLEQVTNGTSIRWITSFFPAYISDVPPNSDIGFDTVVNVMGQVIMNGYVTPPGTIFRFISGYSTKTSSTITMSAFVTVTATRIA